MPPYRQRCGGSPRAACGLLCAGRCPPAMAGGGLWFRGLPASALRALRRVCAAWACSRRPAIQCGGVVAGRLETGELGFRRLRAAGERHPSWVSRAHPSLPLRGIATTSIIRNAIFIRIGSTAGCLPGRALRKRPAVPERGTPAERRRRRPLPPPARPARSAASGTPWKH